MVKRANQSLKLFTTTTMIAALPLNNIRDKTLIRKNLPPLFFHARFTPESIWNDLIRGHSPLTLSPYKTSVCDQSWKVQGW